MEEKEGDAEGERGRDNEEREDNGDRDGAENDDNGEAVDLEKPELVEIKSDSDDSDVEHLITLDRKREKKDRRSDSGRRESRKDPKDLLKDRWGKRGDSREKDRESRDRERGSRDRRGEERSSRRRSSRSREREIKERQKERELRHKAAEEKRGAGAETKTGTRREGAMVGVTKEKELRRRRAVMRTWTSRSTARTPTRMRSLRGRGRREQNCLPSLQLVDPPRPCSIERRRRDR